MTEDGKYYKQIRPIKSAGWRDRKPKWGYPLVPSIFLSLIDEIHIYVYQLPFRYCSNL